MPPRPVPWWLGYAAAGVSGLIVWSGLPLGVPGEWTWSVRPIEFLLSPSVLLAIAAIAFYLAAAAGLSRLVADGRVMPVVAACGVSLMAIGLLLALQLGIPGVSGLMRSPFVLFDFRATGYFTESRERVDDLGGFLRGYEATVAKGDYLHQGTHPPGLITGYILLGRLVKAVPAVRSFSEAIRSPEASDTLAVLADYPTPPTPDEAATLHLFGLLTVAAAAAAIIPLASLIARVSPAADAIRLAALWPLVPALAVFLPKSDALLPVIPLAVAVLYLRALEGQGQPRLLLAYLSGIVSGFGLLISLAVLPVYAAVALAPLSPKRLRADWPVIAAGVGGVATWLIGFAVIGVDLPAIWIQNLRNHATFYDHNERTAWLWGAINVVEAAIATSLPIVAAAVWRAKWQIGVGIGPITPVARVVIGVGVVWVVLLVSGKNQGEAARLWLVLMPWLIAAIGCPATPLTARTWWHLAIAAGLAAVLVVVRVDGFGLLDQIGSVGSG